MKTGFYVRFKKDGKWDNLDIADLTNEEFREFIQSHSLGEGQNWAIALHRWIIEKIVFTLEGDES